MTDALANYDRDVRPRGTLAPEHPRLPGAGAAPRARKAARALGSHQILRDIALGLTLAGLLTAVTVKMGLLYTIMGVFAIWVGYFVLARAGRGLALAVWILLVIPYWQVIGPSQATVPRVAMVLAVLGLLAGRRRHLALVPADAAVLALALLIAVSWDPGGGLVFGVMLDVIVALSFYAWARMAESADVTPRIVWALAVGGAIAALSVLFEYFVTKSPLVVDPAQYAWGQGADHVYRPGGLFGSPYAASAALAMIAVCVLPLLKREQGMRKLVLWALLALLIAGNFVTFTRAGYIGLGAALLIYGVFGFSWTAAKRWIAGAFVVLLALNLVVLPSLNNTKTTSIYKRGVLRAGTFSARQDYWREAIPIATDTPQHTLVGRGYGVLLGGNSGGLIDARLATAPELVQIGPHNQYVRWLIENGIVGLALFVGWLVTCMTPILRMRSLDPEARRFVAALVGAVVAFALVSAVDDTFRDPQLVALVAVIAGLAVSRAQQAARR